MTEAPAPAEYDSPLYRSALAEEKRVSPRLASLMLGVSRVAEGKRLRGLYP